MAEDKYKNIVSVLTISIGFVILYFITNNRYFLTVTLIISVASLISPYLASKINLGWTWLGKAMGLITGTIILTLLFFMVLVPIAFVSNRKRRKAFFIGEAPAESTFISREHTFEKADMENIW